MLSTDLGIDHFIISKTKRSVTVYMEDGTDFTVPLGNISSADGYVEAGKAAYAYIKENYNG